VHDCAAKTQPSSCLLQRARVQARQESINPVLSDAAEVRQPLPCASRAVKGTGYLRVHRRGCCRSMLKAPGSESSTTIYDGGVFNGCDTACDTVAIGTCRFSATSGRADGRLAECEGRADQLSSA
jgi:hypothetical protein